MSDTTTTTTTTTSSPPPSQPPEYPPIDPTTFDLISIGTSLPSSILSAAASTAGKSVLHLDPNPFYGSQFSSLSPPDLSSLLLPPPQQPPSLSTTSEEFSLLPITTRHLYSSVDLPPLPPHLTKLTLDISGPKTLFCADNAIELLLRSGVSHYLEFKGVEASLFYDGDGGGRLISVPDSLKAMFSVKWLSPIERIKLSQFFKCVQKHLSADEDDNGGDRIQDRDLDRPFFEFLTDFPLPKRIIQIILYAIALADYDQEDTEVCKHLLTTRDGINRLALYHSSIGRFPNAHGAMLYPMYGQGELPQAFCRRAAVKGCIYVLRMPVAAVLAEKDTGLYRGVRLASGQDIFSQKLIMDPHLVVPQASVSSVPDEVEERSQHPCPEDITNKVARAICISRTSLKPDVSNLLIVYPPRSLHPEQATSVRALQLSSNTAVCPVGMFVIHLSAVCDDSGRGKTMLAAAITSLFNQPASGTADADSAENPEETPVASSAVPEQQKPVLEWSTLYIQEMAKGSVDTISMCPTPDGSLSYHDLVGATEKMFQEMFPGEDSFPQKAPSDEDADDSDGDTDTVDPE